MKKTATKVIVLTILLAIFGIFMVYSASYYAAAKNYGDAFYFAKKQIIGVVIGAVLMIIISFIPPKFYKKYAYLFAGIGLILLIIVLIPALSVENYGARRWIKIPFLGTLAPGEVAKFCFVIFVAMALTNIKEKKKTILNIIMPLVLFGAYAALIMFQPNFSTVMCLGFIFILMLFVGGLQIKQFLLLGSGAGAAAIALLFAEPYRLKRLTAFLDPWQAPLAEGFQLIQSLYSLASGGLFGLGYLQSRQKYLFLPFSESDFIFSIIGEEFGLFGMLALMIVFLVLVVSIIKIALNAKTRHSCYLCFGIAAVIAVQVLVNIAVVSGAIPPTGLPLPFISAGSTSLVVFFGAIGMVLGVYRYDIENKEIFNFLKKGEKRKLLKKVSSN